MPVRIRLSRGGAKKRPFYRIVVADSRRARDGKFIDQIGTYNPMLPKDSADRVKMDLDKAKEWIAKGAKPSDRIFIFFIESISWFTTSKLISDEIRTFSNSSKVKSSIFLFFKISKILKESIFEVLLNLSLNIENKLMLFLLITYHFLPLCIYRILCFPL